MQCEVSSAALARMLLEARRAYPAECCGLLLGRQMGAAAFIRQISPARNVHPSPCTHFSIDPRALIDAQRAARQGGPQVLGYYHSHPCGPPAPSATDQAMAAHDGRIWAIVSPARPTGRDPAQARPAIRFWRDGDYAFEALPYRLASA